MRKNETVFDNVEIEQIFYDKNVIICSEEQSVCKILLDQETQRLIFSIKVDKDTGWLLDPKDEKYSNEFVIVPYTVYQLYINYLKSKSDIYLLKARKEMIR